MFPLALVASLVVMAGCGQSEDSGVVTGGAQGSDTEAVERDSGSFSSLGDGEAPDPDAPSGGADLAGGSPDPSDGDGPSTGSDDDRTSSGDGVVLGGDTDFADPDRSDGLVLVFENESLGPVPLGATVDELRRALGSGFEIAEVENIRPGFPLGHSISRGGEVLFWAVEQSGQLDLFMTVNPKVGLESGLRPKMSLAEAIDLHGEPTFSLGTEQREFATFADGTGGDGPVSVLVAIGEFGGPVGVYDGGGEEPESTEAYQLEDANIKELWFGN